MDGCLVAQDILSGGWFVYRILDSTAGFMSKPTILCRWSGELQGPLLHVLYNVVLYVVGTVDMDIVVMRAYAQRIESVLCDRSSRPRCTPLVVA